MPEERITISLEEFLKYMIKKWKMAGVIIVVCALLFAGGAKLAGEEITVPHSEEYLRYEQELAWHESYLEESILMNLDPTCIYQRTLFIRNISDIELLENYAVSSEIWEELETERSKTYISELVSWNENESGTVELILRHATSEECLETAEYLKEKLVAKDPAAEITIGAEKVVTDEELQEEHLRWYSRINYMNSLLLDAQAGYTIKVNFMAAVITGILAGGVLTIFVDLILFMIQRKRDTID